MDFLKKLNVWFVVGSQHLYGTEALKEVAAHAQTIVDYLNKDAKLFLNVVLKPLGTTPDEITTLCKEANHDPDCVGMMVWMHTFSPAKMWINGLTRLEKPLLQFHTQFNRDLPWSTIDMDFMNLNQTAHGGREFGFMGARLRMPRTVVVGFWQDSDALTRVDRWMRVAAAIDDCRTMKVVRFGDNMREVAVTEGDKVEAQIKFGYSVNYHGVGDLVKVVDAVTDAEIDALVAEYEKAYAVAPELKAGGARHASLRDGARIEAGLRKFLVKGGFTAFTTNFQDLYGLKQLPGLAVQRLMADGYGFGAEGDWKTAALLRTLKVMGHGLDGGTAFMEDYTYHLDPANPLVLGSHMLEVCPSIAADKPRLEVHPLGIGGKEDPVRLVFSAKPGPSLNVTMVDMGNRFRLIANVLETVELPEPLPKLPVACALWAPQPDLKTGAEAWILAGGAHHSVYTQSLTVAEIRILADFFGIELLVIDNDTTIPALKNEIRWNDVAYKLGC